MLGLGWRHPHHEELLRRLPKLPLLEVHAENFFAKGGAAPGLLMAAREHYEISLHAVGLGLGSAAGLDEAHLQQLAELAARVQPRFVSDHACFARVQGMSGVQHAADLLPVAFDEANLRRLVAHVGQVQDCLRRPLLVENLSAYVRWTGDELAEPQFFNELVRRSGCALLLDVNNLLVNARNEAAGEGDGAMVLDSCRQWIERLDDGSVSEIHVAGHAQVDGLYIDDHGSAPSDACWQLLDHARQRFPLAQGLLEWDTDIPSFDVLLAGIER